MQPCTKRPSHHSATQCNLTLLSIGAGTTPALAGAPLDEQTLTKIAELTQGEYYYAGSAAELKKVYKTLSSRLVFETRETEITVFSQPRPPCWR